MFFLFHFGRVICCLVAHSSRAQPCSLFYLFSLVFVFLVLFKIITVCKYTVHERCVQRAPASCITTYSKKKTKAPATFQHHWTEGNCYGRCSKCRKRIKGYHGITGLTCRWCRMMVSVNINVFVSNHCCV